LSLFETLNIGKNKHIFFDIYLLLFDLVGGGAPHPLETVMSWSYGSRVYNYLCNQCLSPLKLWVWISLMTRCTR